MNYGFSLKVIFKELVYGSNKQSQSYIIITYLFVNLNYKLVNIFFLKVKITWIIALIIMNLTRIVNLVTKWCYNIAKWNSFNSLVRYSVLQETVLNVNMSLDN